MPEGNRTVRCRSSDSAPIVPSKRVGRRGPGRNGTSDYRLTRMPLLSTCASAAPGAAVREQFGQQTMRGCGVGPPSRDRGRCCVADPRTARATFIIRRGRVLFSSWSGGLGRSPLLWCRPQLSSLGLWVPGNLPSLWQVPRVIIETSAVTSGFSGWWLYSLTSHPGPVGTDRADDWLGTKRFGARWTQLQRAMLIRSAPNKIQIPESPNKIQIPE